MLQELMARAPQLKARDASCPARSNYHQIDMVLVGGGHQRRDRVAVHREAAMRHARRPKRSRPLVFQLSVDLVSILLGRDHFVGIAEMRE